MELNISAYFKEWLKVRVEFKTQKDAIEAVKNNGDALQYVPEAMKTIEVVTEAVKKNGGALQYVPEAMKTIGVVTEAVKNNGDALQYVPETIFKDELAKTPAKILVLTKQEIADKLNIDIASFEISQ